MDQNQEANNSNNRPSNLLRSYENRQSARYTFKNLTHRSIDLIWVDFAGNLKYMRTLKPNEFVDINTFKTHVWIAIDSVLKQQMIIENRPIFICPGQNPTQLRPTLNIILPIRTLKLTVMLSLIENNHITNANQTDKLGLPHSLARQLKLILEKIDKLKTGQLIQY